MNVGRHGFFKGNYMRIQLYDIMEEGEFYLFNLVITLCISILETLEFGEDVFLKSEEEYRYNYK